MCDPVTVGIVAGGGAGAAAYGGLLGTAATANIATSATIGLTVGLGAMSISSQVQASKLQKQKFEAQKQRYKEEEKSELIAEIAATNKRKRDYITAYNEKVAQLSSMGRTRDPSFRNILETDKRTLRRDLTYIGFSGFEKRLFNSAMAKESELAKLAVDPTAGIIDTATSIGFKTKELAEG